MGLSRAAKGHTKACRAGCSLRNLPPGSFVSYTRKDATSCPSDPNFPSHPVIRLPRKFHLHEAKYQGCKPFLSITKKPLAGVTSLPLSPWPNNTQPPYPTVLHQRTDGKFTVNHWDQDNFVVCKIMMLRDACVHDFQFRSGKHAVRSGLDAESLQIVEKALLAKPENRQQGLPLSVAGGRPDLVVTTTPTTSTTSSTPQAVASAAPVATMSYAQHLASKDSAPVSAPAPAPAPRRLLRQRERHLLHISLKP